MYFEKLRRLSDEAFCFISNLLNFHLLVLKIQL